MYLRKPLKKVIIFLAVLLVCIPAIFAKNITKPTKICDLFKDKQLAKIVISTLKKSSEKDLITQSELDSIVMLNASKRPGTSTIHKLDGLEYLNNLEQLFLGGNDITDLYPLTNLIKLWELHLLFNTNLQDITPLKKLTNMQRLTLVNTAVESISALANMKNLYWVCLQGSHVNDFKILSGFSHLEICDIQMVVR